MNLAASVALGLMFRAAAFALELNDDKQEPPALGLKTIDDFGGIIGVLHPSKGFSNTYLEVSVQLQS